MSNGDPFMIANRLTYDNANRNTFGLRPIGRLRAAATVERAQQEVEAVAARIRDEHPIARLGLLRTARADAQDAG